MTNMFKSPLEDDWDAREIGWLEPTEWVSSWLLNPSPAEVTLWWDTNSFRYFVNSERSTDYLFPKFLCQQFSNHVPSKSPTIHPNYWPQPMNWYIYMSGHFSLQKVNNQVHFLKFHLLGGFSFITALQGCPRKGLQCCRHPLSSGANISCWFSYKPGLSFHIFCQLIIGNSPWGHKCRLGERQE